MWRSFFLAVGIFTIVVGLESMVVDQVVMTNVRRVPRIVSATARNLVNPSSPSGIQTKPLESGPQTPYQMPTFKRPLASGPPTSGGNAYRGTQAATFNRGFDPTVRNRAAQQPATGFAGFQSAGNNLAPPPAAVPKNKPRVRRPRIIQVKDWMPWSLLAAGTIIVLYTQSHGRNDD